MNSVNTLVCLMVVMCGLVVLSEGDNTGKKKTFDRRNLDVPEKSQLKSDNDHVDDSIKNSAHSSQRGSRKTQFKIHKKRRITKRKKFKLKNMRKKAKSRKNMESKALGNHTSRTFHLKSRSKSLALTRSKVQSQTVQNLAAKSEGVQQFACDECNPQECPSFEAMVEYCPSGVAKDQCGCCFQCASSVGMPCYLSVTPLKWIAPCGNDLECVPATMRESDLQKTLRVWGSKVSLEGVCFCKFKTAVCSSDEVTYENICEYREAAFRQLMITSVNISISHNGPCRSAPKINSKPTDVSEKEGSVVSFRCETSGFPLPRVHWIKKRGNVDNGRDLDLPGYLKHAVTQVRGGPRKYQLTTWLTLDRVTEEDNGVYICRSSNYYGIEDAAASLRITGK